jgi:voltage-gated potassium channel
MGFELSTQLLLAVAMFALTIALQMAATLGAIELRRRRWGAGKALTGFGATLQLGVITSGLLILAFLQSFAWALMYLWTSGFDSLHSALFFSLSCFSTLGIANYVPAQGHDVLSAMEAIVGSLSMGWSAAIIVAAAHAYYLELHERESVPLNL